jgi:leucyl-tRNA synthetase
MAKQYNPKAIESKWQKEWEKEAALSQADERSGKPKYYILDMFPYPSGDGLHVGHVENYTATDIYARFKRMNGFEVLHPIGWDAFGLPAENFAIKTGVHPDEKTHQNIRNFTRQIKSLGISYDWSREIDTSSPEYYKWTQWFFLFLYEKGLAYKKKANVNWCPSCQTVLANEQVVDGACERCKAQVVQKDLEQWFFRITDFIEDQEYEGRQVSGLLNGLDKIDWPESTKAAQRNWIGRSEGAVVRFEVTDGRRPTTDEKEYLEVFTTRVDTIFGCTYVVVAPEHPLLKNQESRIKNQAEVEGYLAEVAKKTELERTDLAKEKTGVRLEGIKAVNPFTGEAVPVFAADYVLGNYGTGAVMAVPAHDERDFEFAKKYNLPMKLSVAPFFTETEGKDAVRPDKPTVRRRTALALVKHWEEDKYLCLDWEKFGWHSGIIGGIEDGEDPIEAAKREIVEETGYQNPLFRKFVGEAIHTYFFAAHKQVNRYADGVGMLFELKDESWEEPKEEEIVNHKAVWIEGREMAKFLNFKNFQYMWQVLEKGEECFAGDGMVVNSGEFSGMTSREARERMAQWLEKNGLGRRQINYRVRDWLISRQRYWGAPIPIIYCDACGTVPVPEKDLPVKLPTDVDFRPTGESPLARSKSFQDVKCPRCGGAARREADTMDTFVCSSWYYLRFADPKNARMFADPEKLERWLPVDFYMGGAEHTVLHLLYARFFTKALCKYGYVKFDEPFLKLRHQGMVLAEDGRKMSKSLGNVVNPDDVVGAMGADTLRLYEMFMGPLDESKSWNTASIVGLRRFLEKVWRLSVKCKVKSEKRDAENAVLLTLMHKTIEKATADIENLRFNTAISSLMVLTNAFEKETEISEDAYAVLLVLLAPFAPHIAEELWQSLGNEKSIFLEAWPKADPKYLKEDEVELVVQVNGKLRGRVKVKAGADQEEAQAAALEDVSVKAYVDGKQIRKVVYVADRLLNFVVN